MTEEKPVQKEYQYYLKIKASLLAQHKDKFALIKNDELVGTYDTDQDAYKVGLEKFGNVPILIIRVQQDEEKVWIPVTEKLEDFAKK